MTPRRTALIAAALVPPALLATMLVAPTIASAASTPSLELVGRYQVTGGAEVSAYMDGNLYVINGEGIDIVPVVPMSTSLGKSTSIDLKEYGAAVTSVAAKDGLIAAAVPNDEKTLPGKVVVMDATGTVLKTVTVGALPDMLTFDDKGQMLVVANEGEPEGYEDGDVDPEGSVTVIYVDRLLKSQGKSVTTIGFTDFNVGGPRNAELTEDVRIFGPGASVAEDLEPEYITIVGNRGYVTLQENNAIAELDLRSGKVLAIRALGLKDHSKDDNGFGSSNALDPSDKNGVAIANWEVKGMYMPDGIASMQVNGKTFLVTANEGDAREYSGLIEEADFGSDAYVLDPDSFNPLVFTAEKIAALKAESALGRLKVSTASGDTDGDGKFDEIHAFGARSFSIWSADGGLVWDSGDQIEQITAVAPNAKFNANNTSATADSRSRNKGPEPEGVTIGTIDGRTYAYVGLERVGGMAVFDVTNPAKPAFVEYVNSRNYAKTGSDITNDSGPEVLSFVPASESSTGRPLVIMSNEISGSVTIWSPKQPQG